MVIYTISIKRYQISLKGDADDLELLSRVKTAISGAHGLSRMNYKSPILKEKIQAPVVNKNSCELLIQCKSFDGVSEVVGILKDEFNSENIKYLENEEQLENIFQKSTSSLNYYEIKSKASLINKVLPEEESKINDDNINNQNRPTNNSF